MPEDFDLRIEEKRHEITEAKWEMEQLKERFKDALSDYTEEWYQTYARKLIVNNPETSGKLTDAELKELKDEVKNLARSAGEYIDLHFDKDELWWHLKENTYSYSEYMDKRLPPILSEEVSYLLGRLGQLFLKHKVIQAGVKSSYTSESYKFDFVIDQTSGRKELKLKHVGGFPNHITNLMEEYNKLLGKAKHARSQIEELLEVKRRTSIGDLWDSL